MSGWLDTVRGGKYVSITPPPPQLTQKTQKTDENGRFIRLIGFIPGVDEQELEFNAVRDFLALVRITGACECQILLKDEAILAAVSAKELAQLPTMNKTQRQQQASQLAHSLVEARLGGWE